MPLNSYHISIAIIDLSWFALWILKLTIYEIYYVPEHLNVWCFSFYCPIHGFNFLKICLKRQRTFFGLNFDLRNTESRVHTCLSYSLVVLFVYSEGEESSSYSSVPDLTPNSRSSTADSRNSYGKLSLSLCVFAFFAFNIIWQESTLVSILVYHSVIYSWKISEFCYLNTELTSTCTGKLMQLQLINGLSMLFDTFRQCPWSV